MLSTFVVRAARFAAFLAISFSTLVFAQGMPATATLRARVTFKDRPAPAGITLRATYPGGVPQFKAKTDANGVADFGTVPVGTYRITRGPGDVTSFSAPIKEGETRCFDIAITGRTIKGHIAFPDSTTARPSQLLAGVIDPLQFPRYTLPRDILGWSPTQRARWYDAIESDTEVGRSIVRRRVTAESAGPRYVNVSNDGAFEITGATEGPVWFRVYFDAGQKTAAAYRVDMPAIEGGASIDPLLIDAIPPQSLETLAAGQTVPDIVFKDADGTDRLLSEFRGKTVLLDFWGVWCGFCIKDLPNFKRLHEAYAGDPNFLIISLSVDDAFDEWKAYIKANGMVWTQGCLGSRENAWPAKAFGVLNYPSCYLIGPDGALIATAMQVETLRPYIDSALRAKG